MTRLPLALAGIVVMGLLFWFILSKEREGILSAAGSKPQNGSDVLRTSTDRPVQQSFGSATSGKRHKGSTISEEGADGLQFPLVDQILADEGLSNEVAAARLWEIVANKDLSVLEREEALAHGLNLDLPRFLKLVSDPQVPQPLAQRFFDEMLNYNEYRDLQVRACISLVDHENAAIREDAAEQLAFYIGLEEWADKPEELKQQANAFLEDLAKLPPKEPEPVDPEADIPETAPINPLENQQKDVEKTDDMAEPE